MLKVEHSKNWKGNAVIYFIYLFLATIFTYPLILHLANSLPGWPLDGYNYLWNIDTFWFEALKLSNPFYTQRIFYPLGTNLIFHTYAPLVSLFGLPFLRNLILYQNLLIIFSLSSCSFFTYLLIKSLTKNNSSSFIGGLFYGLSPIILSYIWSQHYYFLYAAQFLPLGALFLIKFLKDFKWKYLFHLYLTFWAVFFIDYYTTVIFILLCITITTCHFLLDSKNTFNRLGRNIRSLLFTSLIILVLPAICYFAFAFKTSADFISLGSSKNNYPELCNTNLTEFVTPSFFNPLLKNLNQTIHQKYNLDINYDTPSYFVGYITLSLVLFWSVKYFRNKNVFSFLVFGLLIFGLSLGPILKIGDRVIDFPFLPFTYFSKLPFMNFIDCPLRFPDGIALSLSVIIGIGLSATFSKKGFITKLLLLSVMLAIFMLEYGSAGMLTTKVSFPKVYQEIKNSMDNKTVLELPSGISESKGAFGYDWSISALHLKQLYWQTIYKKPRVGGYTSRLAPKMYHYFKNEPVLSDLFVMSSLDGEWTGKIYSHQEVNDFITKFNIGYLVLSPNPRQEYFEKTVEKLLKSNILKKTESEGFILYIIGKDGKEN